MWGMLDSHDFGLFVFVTSHGMHSPHKLFRRSLFIDAAVKDSEAVLGVWLPAPLPTPRALPDHGALWPLAVGGRNIWAVSMFDLAV